MSQATLFDLTPPAKYVNTGALISADGQYRYRLWRVWDEDSWIVVWVLLNPSTADASTDDPTLRRCMAFARAWHAGGVILVNLFAARATNPEDLKTMVDPVGPENDEHIRWACTAPYLAKAVCGWGAHAMVKRDNRERAVRSAVCGWRGKAWCLGTTMAGHPRHPLYASGSTTLEEFK